MTAPAATTPVLACYDGSEGSRQALRLAGRVLGPQPIVVLTVWQRISTQLARAGGFGALGGFEHEGEVDQQEQAAARQAAEEGAASAREQGFDATARVEEGGRTEWETIVAVANEIDASIVVCGSRGRGMLGSLLGSTSAGILHHAHRPVLISPEPPKTG